jgi:1,4-alpha-glucan branching enzyme
VGGLGFGMKWDMGWMHDTLRYMSKDPVHRRFHHNDLTFRMIYAFNENFVLPLSHDEVVHGKGSLWGIMPGDEWQKFANLRLLYGLMHAHPGKKLLFMGGELGQRGEWNHDATVEWHLMDEPRHMGILRWVSELNRLHREEPALHTVDFDALGFEWIDGSDSDQSVLSFLRKGEEGHPPILAVFNFTPVPRSPYRVGVPCGGYWREIANSDADVFGGSGMGNMGGLTADEAPSHGKPFALTITLPPLAALFFRAEG